MKSEDFEIILEQFKRKEWVYCNRHTIVRESVHIWVCNGVSYYSLWLASKGRRIEIFTFLQKWIFWLSIRRIMGEAQEKERVKAQEVVDRVVGTILR